MGREPCSGVEEEVADRLEMVMPAEGIRPGARECHDAQPGRHRADWIYSDASPRPFALEVTSIVAAVDRGGGQAIMGLGERLTALAEEEELGAWIVVLRTDRNVGTMEPESNAADRASGLNVRAKPPRASCLLFEIPTAYPPSSDGYRTQDPPCEDAPAR